MPLFDSLYEPPIASSRGEAAARVTPLHSTHYGPVVYYCIPVEGRDFGVSSPAGPRPDGANQVNSLLDPYPASRSEEEDRELVPRRRGPAALDLRLLRRRHVALVDASLEVEALDPVRRGPDRLALLDLRATVGAIDFSTAPAPRPP